ncbi:MAG TPA: sigma-70 family RNA polymerase sigma factor [Acidimicrobiales bacterium]|nr:sigma-70 family RNA polymerase sigma factor [Acidimicrobiales bacterium]
MARTPGGDPGGPLKDVERNVDDLGVSRASFGPGFDSVLQAARAGAPWALERLYLALSPAVLGYLRVQGASDPEDLANEVFLGVFRRIPSFEGSEEAFRSWVFTIAHSRLIDDRRRMSRRPQLAPDAGDIALDLPAGDAEQDALERLSSRRVQALCEGLVADQRDVLLLRLMAGMTVEAIAESLGKSEGAVKALQRRGLANLRKILEPDPVSL